MYRLTPLDAYRLGLVKQIEVAGIEREADANRPLVRLVSIKVSRKRCSARLAVQVLRRTGGVRERQVNVYPGDDLAVATERPEYSGFIVDEVNPGSNTVRFTNNVELAVGETRGDDRVLVFENQIRYTIREHLLRQERLRRRGIKVVSLFFVDCVANYAGDDPIIRNIFDRVFDELKASSMSGSASRRPMFEPHILPPSRVVGAAWN